MVRKLYKLALRYLLNQLKTHIEEMVTARLTSELGAINKALDANKEGLKEILSKLSPNGGTSIADKLNQVLSNQTFFESKFRTFLSDSKECYFEADKDGEITFVNTKLSRLTGRDSQELKGSGIFNIVDYSERESFIEDWKTALEENLSLEKEFTLVTPAKNRIKVYLSLKRISDTKEETIGFLGTITQL